MLQACERLNFRAQYLIIGATQVIKPGALQITDLPCTACQATDTRKWNPAVMATEHKPLFNPLYLKVLILILPILIVLLASLGPKAVTYPEIEHSETHPLYWIEQPDRPDNELRLLLPAAVALDPEQRILQQTLATLLQQRLQQPALQSLLTPVPYSQVTALPDHLQISLRWPAGEKLPALDAVLQALQQTPESDSAAATLARIRAQAYLDGQDPAQRLLNRLQQQLQQPTQRARTSAISAADVLQQYHRLFSRPPLLILGGPDAAKLAEQLDDAGMFDSAVTAERSEPGHQPERHAATPLQTVKLQLSDARLPAMYLLGASMPGRDAKDYAAQLLAIRSLQRALELRPDTAGYYRLVWQQSRDSGYRALILAGQPTRAQTLPAEAQRTAAPPADERVTGSSIIDSAVNDSALIDTAVISAQLIDDTRQQLLLQLREQLQTPQGQLDQLATLAFNNLPGQRLDTILDQLQALSGDDIGPRIAHYLAPEPQILITLNGQ
jgi:predicted Zn-dependent peptidase